MLYNKEKTKVRREIISDFKNYCVVVIIFILDLLIPLLGSYIGGKTQLPTTTTEWILYFAINTCTAIGSVCIFLALHNQGKDNVKDTPEYTQARQLHFENMRQLNKNDIKPPVNPELWDKKSKITKSITTFIGVFLGLFGIGLAVLTYNTTVLLSCIISFIIAVSMGLVHMAKCEQIWSDGYLEYERYVRDVLNEQRTNINNNNTIVLCDRIDNINNTNDTVIKGDEEGC